MIWYILIVNSLLAFKLAYDYHAKNVEHRIINHTISIIVFGIIMLVAAWFLLGFEAGKWIVLTMGYWWLMFDLLFNLINKDKYNHIGGSAGTDKMLKWIESKGISQYVPKLLLIGIGILLLTL